MRWAALTVGSSAWSCDLGRYLSDQAVTVLTIEAVQVGAQHHLGADGRTDRGEREKGVGDAHGALCRTVSF